MNIDDPGEIDFMLPVRSALWAPVYLAKAKAWYGLLPTDYSINLCYASSGSQNLDKAVVESVGTPPARGRHRILFGACDPYQLLQEHRAKAICSLLPRMAFWAVSKNSEIDLNASGSGKHPSRILCYPEGMTGAILAELLKERFLRLNVGTAIEIDVECQGTPGNVLSKLRDVGAEDAVLGITLETPSDISTFPAQYSFAQDPEFSHYLTTCVIASESLRSDPAHRESGDVLMRAVVGSIQLAALELRRGDEQAISLAFNEAKKTDATAFDNQPTFGVHLKTAVENELIPFSVRIDKAVWRNGIRLRDQVAPITQPGKTLDDVIDTHPADNVTRRYLLRATPAVPRTNVLFISALPEEHRALVGLAGELGAERFHARDVADASFSWCVIQDRSRRERVFTFAQSSQMGETAAAVRLGIVIAQFSITGKPRCLAMNGICGGHPSKTRLADLVVADRLFKLDEGKTEEGKGHFGDVRTFMVPEAIRRELRQCIAEWDTAARQDKTKLEEGYTDHDHIPLGYHQTGFEVLDELRSRRPESREQLWNFILSQFTTRPYAEIQWEKIRDGLASRDPLPYCEVLKSLPIDFDLGHKGLIAISPAGLSLTNEGAIRRQLLDVANRKRPWATDPEQIKIHLAPIATASHLQKDPKIWDSVERHVRTTLGIEMEAAAVGVAGQEMGIPFVIAKAVVDHTDGNKGDTFHSYGCKLSAAFLFDFFLRRGFPERLFE